MNPNDEVKKENEIDWDKLLWHSLIAVASHPITQARVCSIFYKFEIIKEVVVANLTFTNVSKAK